MEDTKVEEVVAETPVSDAPEAPVTESSEPVAPAAEDQSGV